VVTFVASQMDVRETQLPATQTWLELHAFPHAPQFAGSVWRTAQDPPGADAVGPQSVHPGWHAPLHDELTQTPKPLLNPEAGLQMCPQVPQL
jgi:hypothetical protein